MLQRISTTFYNHTFIVSVAQGTVIGTRTSETGIFWGIPFSRPQVGDFRWQNP